jgi:hypothetical protein
MLHSCLCFNVLLFSGAAIQFSGVASIVLPGYQFLLPGATRLLLPGLPDCSIRLPSTTPHQFIHTLVVSDTPLVHTHTSSQRHSASIHTHQVSHTPSGSTQHWNDILVVSSYTYSSYDITIRLFTTFSSTTQCLNNTQHMRSSTPPA